MKSNQDIVILGTGDIAPDRDDPSGCFSETSSLLHSADLVFGQLETVLATTGSRSPQARHAVLSKPEIAQALTDAGFDIISCAGNHCLDWGPAALVETLEHLKDAGLMTAGAGGDIDKARAPAIFTTKQGQKIAVIAYSSILPQDYWATESRVGCAPMRAHTLYEQIEHDQPGTPPRIISFPHREDLAALFHDIQEAKKKANIVIVSLHWGIHFVRAEIADYQRDIARAVIDAGADAIFGHHAHILKGIEIIKDKPVFYSLCNFATDLRMDEEHASRPSFKEIQSLADEWIPDFDSLYNFPTDSRYSIIARLGFNSDSELTSGFYPVYIGRDAIPRIVEPDDPKFNEVLDYIKAISIEAGFSTNFKVQGSFVIVQ